MTAIDLEAFMLTLARLSGEAILPFFRTSIGFENKKAKSAFDPVTEADKAGEAAMRHLIKQTFPAHGIHGEEFGIENPEADYVWILDPIDGTKSFLTGIPLWGTLIGLSHHGHPEMGLMHQPFTQELFIGNGSRAHYKGPLGTREMHVRPCERLSDAVMMTTSPLLFGKDERKAYDKVEKEVRLTRYGADCYAYCMLASGHVDLVIEAGLAPYDIAPLIPIIQGAGGIVTTWDGKPASEGGRIIAAGDKAIHAAAMDLLM